MDLENSMFNLYQLEHFKNGSLEILEIQDRFKNNFSIILEKK